MSYNLAVILYLRVYFFKYRILLECRILVQENIELPLSMHRICWRCDRADFN